MRTMNGSPCLHYDCSNRNSFGYCKTTVCINEHYQQEQLESTSNRAEPVVVKPKTHYDKIRNMSVEEMRDEYFYILHNVLCRYTDSRGGLLMWLKEEVKE